MIRELRAGKAKGLPLEFNRLVSLGILVVLMLVATLSNPAFLTLSNLLGVLEQNAARGVMALGATFVLITGGIDLSMGNGLATIYVAASILYFTADESAAVLIILCVLFGIALGATNGFLIAKLKLLPFVATLGMMSISRGITLSLAQGRIVFLNNHLALMIGNGQLFGFFPVQALIFFIMAALAALILYRTKLGVSIYAIGGNEEATGYSGINTALQKFKVYLLNGAFIGVAALLTVTRVGQISPNLGAGAMMDALAAVVIGGTSTLGGRGTIGGTIIGVCIIGVLTNMLTFMNIPINIQSAIKGMVILFAIVTDALFRQIKEKK